MALLGAVVFDLNGHFMMHLLRCGKLCTFQTGLREQSLMQVKELLLWVNRDGFARSLAGPVYSLRADMQAIGGLRRDGQKRTRT
jgi:hypothetical protein